MSTTNPSTSTPRPKEEKETNDGNGTGLDMLKSISSAGHYRLKNAQQIFQLRRDSVDVDVQFLCKQSGDKNENGTIVMVPCHKIFLRTCPYFAKLLDTAPNDPADGQILKIDIDLDPEILDEILRFIYTGEINITSQNMVQLFEASIKFQLNEVLMVKFKKLKIGQLINEDNWLGWLRIFNSADASCGKMKEIFAFLREKSSEFMNWPLFLQLTFDEIRLILNPESRVYKNAKDFQASLLKWMAHDYDANTKGVLIDELSTFSYVGLPEIIDLSEPAAEDQIQDDCTTESSSDSDDSEDSPMTKRMRLSLTPPSPSQSLLFCAGNYFYIYSFQKKKSRKLVQLPTLDLHGFSMVLADDRLLIIGGYDPSTGSYDLSKKVYSCPLPQILINKHVSWKNEQDFLEMANFSTICLNDKIYTIGGIYNFKGVNIFHKPLSSSYCYERNIISLEDGWKSPRFYFNCKLPRSQCAVAMLNDKLYIVGGFGVKQNLPIRASMWGKGPERFKLGFEDTVFDSVEVFNFSDKSVESVASLRLPRSNHQVVAFQNKIFAIGGKVLTHAVAVNILGKRISYGLTNSVEIYDPETKVWTDGPSLNVPRANFAAFVMEEKIYVLGGNLEKNFDKPTMEIYDPRQNKWELVPCGDFPDKPNFSNFLLI